MNELSIFVDESGDQTDHSRYFLLALLFHVQGDAISDQVTKYERALEASGLPNVPFHSEPLLNGHGGYKNLSLGQRKRMLVAFNIFVQRLPVRYRVFVYKRQDFESPEKLAERLRCDIEDTIDENLEFFQSFERVKVYCDNRSCRSRRRLASPARKTVQSLSENCRKPLTTCLYKHNVT